MKSTTVYVRANDPIARELLRRAVKWLDRLTERRASIPHFFDNDTDPAPLAKDVRRYLRGYSSEMIPDRETKMRRSHGKWRFVKAEKQ